MALNKAWKTKFCRQLVMQEVNKVCVNTRSRSLSKLRGKVNKKSGDFGIDISVKREVKEH